jgi:hypothetical protein
MDGITWKNCDGVSSCTGTYLNFNLVHVKLEESSGELADENVHGLFELSDCVLSTHVHIGQDVQVHSGVSTYERVY